jgi:hypothetical protein
MHKVAHVLWRYTIKRDKRLGTRNPGSLPDDAAVQQQPRPVIGEAPKWRGPGVACAAGEYVRSSRSRRQGEAARVRIRSFLAVRTWVAMPPRHQHVRGREAC